MQTLSGLKKLAGPLGLAICLAATSVSAQNAGDNWTYGEDFNAGQLALTYQLGASTPASIWCHRNSSSIELTLMLPAQNIAAGQLINAQVVMDTKPFQLSTSSTIAKGSMLEAKFLLPTNGNFMNNAIASTQMQFGIPGQQYQTVYFPPSKQDFANFNGKCQWMQTEAKKQANPQKVQQANQNQQGKRLKVISGKNGWNSRILRTQNDIKKAENVEFYLDADGSRKFTGYCELNSRFDLYVADTTRTLADGSVTVEFISGNQRIARDGHMQGAGTDKPEIYMAAGSADLWEMMINNFFAYHANKNAGQPYTPISVVANGRKLYTMPHVDPMMLLASVGYCGLSEDKIKHLHALIVDSSKRAVSNAQVQQVQQTQQIQQSQTANTGTPELKYAEWKLFPGTNRNAQFHITNPNNGNQIMMFCTPQNPDIIHAYIKHGKVYNEQRKITLNSVGQTTVKMHHNITGTTTKNGIYLALKHDDPHWGIIGNWSTYSVNGTQIASFPINAFGTDFYDDLKDFRFQCGTTQAHIDAISAAIKPHGERVFEALRNGQDAFIDLNAVSVAQPAVQQPITQQQNTQQTQQGNNGGENNLQQGLNTLGQVLQLGKQIVDLKNKLQGNSGNQNPAPQTSGANNVQQQPIQQQPAQQNPANQQVTYSNLATYTCENGAQFQVRYEGGDNFDRAVLIMQGIQPVLLPSVRSGSGVRYFDGQIEWHTKGPDGILKQNGQELICEER